jgi:hypothetical protein
MANCWWDYLPRNSSAPAAIFPPGDTHSPRHKIHSRWREFSFALHQLRQAIDPPLALAATMANWNTLAADLAESSRKRVPQVPAFFAR